MFIFPFFFFFASGTNKLMIINKLLLLCIQLSAASRIYPEIKISSFTNFRLFIAQIYCMASEDLEYSTYWLL